MKAPLSSYSPEFNKKLRYGAIAVLAVLIIAGGLYFYLDHKYRAIIADFNKSLQPTGALTYSSMDVSPFLGKVTLGNPVIMYQAGELIKAEKMELQGLRGSGAQLTHAKIHANNLQFSPTGRNLADIPAGTNSAFAVSGELKTEYGHDPASNSYDLKSFSFETADKRSSIEFDHAKLDNLKFSDKNSIQALSFAIENAKISNLNMSLSAGTGTEQRTVTEFSTSFAYEKMADGSFEVRNFNLKLPEINDYAAFDLVRWHTDNTTLPLTFLTEIKGLDIPVGLHPQTAEFWKPYGYTRIKSDTKIGYVFDKETKKVNAQLLFDSPSLFKTNVTAVLTGLDLAALAQDPNANILLTFENLQLESAEVNFTDASFLKKTLEIEAQKQNITVPEYAAKLGADIDQAFLADPANASDPALVDAAGKLKAYVGTLGTLTINMKPAQPVPFSQVMIGLILDRVKLLKAMGVTVTVS
ncbi:MAG: hypothetical protein EYC62_07925 [Alphaproteobacteria bacterium]|nr:MAG: hypothetical protein EYC62_07925 [Alphaproteobacteria bacterium]